MLRTRLGVGGLLIVLAAGMLAVDERLLPWCPFLFLLVLPLGLASCFELLNLLGPSRRPVPWICYLGIVAVVTGNWPGHLPETSAWQAEPWGWIVGCFAACVLAVFMHEMAGFREPGRSLERMALALWVIAYLGLLPSFFIQLRWLDANHPEAGTQGLALAIFVPKTCDIGAYFTGRFLGRHKMTPVLSPKKTWEGAAGGLAAATLTTALLDRLLPGSLLRGDLGLEIGFALAVGITSMLGDLAESLIKRDCQQKDASHVVPGFGGVLDVIDSVIFPAPLVYLWLSYLASVAA